MTETAPAIRTRTLRLGTRGSDLALAQSGLVARELEALHPGLKVELVPKTTRGDIYRGDLAEVGGKGLFTEELEKELLDGTLDFAVHSLKDLPVTLGPGLTVAAFPRRADPRDVLVGAKTVHDLPQGGSVLTGSQRRRSQLLLARPDLDVRPIRGNVGTRLGKWRAGDGDAVILAAAGIDRLGIENLDLEPSEAHRMDPALMIPAPGQGTLALEVRTGSEADALCRGLNDPATERDSVMERKIVAAFGGDCTLPLAAWAREENGELRLSAVLAMPDGSRAARGEARGDDPDAVTQACLDALHADGAAVVLQAMGRSSS
ncbi:MAG: hydroxymethylbilane synthase [Acidobacteriota bacterium]|nr:hydroxymethylbilane synthase [Acidobacteriota bacterium]